jgi:toxin ParE1/3/4
LNVFYDPRALAEYRSAYWWYEDIRLGLGEQFSSQVQDAIKIISEFPLAARKVKHEARCKRIHKFPYNLIFIPESDSIRIIAVFHDKRDPQEWQIRLMRKLGK